MPSVEVELVDPGHRIQFKGKRSWGHAREISIDREWAVKCDGTVVGRIWYAMRTHEQRSPGKMYVNSRWQSPGWVFSTDPASTRYSRHREAHSKKYAIEQILLEAGH